MLNKKNPQIFRLAGIVMSKVFDNALIYNNLLIINPVTITNFYEKST